MNAKELRIGNLVQDKTGDVMYVYRIWKGGAELSGDENGSDDLDYDEDEIFGIPITESWLVKLGFESIGEGSTKMFRKGVFNWYPIAGLYLEFDNGVSGYDLQTECKYVHELQNLFFLIERKELIIKHQKES